MIQLCSFETCQQIWPRVKTLNTPKTCWKVYGRRAISSHSPKSRFRPSSISSILQDPDQCINRQRRVVWKSSDGSFLCSDCCSRIALVRLRWGGLQFLHMQVYGKFWKIWSFLKADGMIILKSNRAGRLCPFREHLAECLVASCCWCLKLLTTSQLVSETHKLENALVVRTRVRSECQVIHWKGGRERKPPPQQLALVPNQGSVLKFLLDLSKTFLFSWGCSFRQSTTCHSHWHTYRNRNRLVEADRIFSFFFTSQTF